MDRLITLAIVPVIVWLGIFVYLLSIDRKIARLERDRKDQDDL